MPPDSGGVFMGLDKKKSIYPWVASRVDGRDTFPFWRGRADWIEAPPDPAFPAGLGALEAAQHRLGNWVAGR